MIPVSKDGQMNTPVRKDMDTFLVYKPRHSHGCIHTYIHGQAHTLRHGLTSDFKEMFVIGAVLVDEAAAAVALSSFSSFSSCRCFHRSIGNGAVGTDCRSTDRDNHDDNGDDDDSHNTVAMQDKRADKATT